MINTPTVERTLTVYAAHCLPNRHEFEVYDFSDFQYGERLIRTTDGENCALLTLKDDVAKEVRNIIAEIQSGRLDEIEVAAQFDRVFGLACDPLDNKEVDASIGFICPICKAQDVNYHEVLPLKHKTILLPVITHEKWRNMSEGEKRSLIKNGLRVRHLI